MIKVRPEQIKLLIRTKKITITKLAESLGVSRQAIYCALAGRPVGGKMISELLKFSGWDFADIFYVEF